MIHPDTQLCFIDDSMGFGVFATKAIPAGTIVYVKDPLEIVISPRQFEELPCHYRPIVEKYSYMDETGSRIVSWDHAKYVNHSCDCNTMSTAYGFEIALRAIEAGEQITDEYGLFNIPHEVEIQCACDNCRLMLLPDDIDRHHRHWDRQLILALEYTRQVPQPLWFAMDEQTREDLERYLDGREAYKSVYNLKYRINKHEYGGGTDHSGHHLGQEFLAVNK